MRLIMGIIRKRGTSWLGALGLLALLAAPVSAEVSVVDGGVRFTFTDPSAGGVSWAGDFNGWNTTANPMMKEGDTWSVVLALPPGEHFYKFVVDDAWIADPENPVTAGEFGNSVVNVAADGSLVTKAATSNTALSPKVLVGGRFIGLFVGSEDDTEGDRLELRRPDFDLDLDFNIRMSDVLDARMLTNVRSETEDVQFFRSRLNLDRGHLHLHSDKIDVYAFDNDAVATWDDPMHLVGNIGIYNHDYGFDQQGIQVSRNLAGNDVTLLYADNFRPGGTGRPSLSGDPPEPVPFGDELISQRYVFTDTDNNKDALAARVTRELSPAFSAGLSGRLDRGQNPGTAGIIVFDTTGAGEISRGTLREGPTIERWWALGGDVTYTRGPSTFRGEYLHGENDLDFSFGSRIEEFDGEIVTVSDDVPSANLAKDDRLRLEWDGPFRGLDWSLAWELHANDVQPIGNDSLVHLDNTMRSWEFTGGRSFRLDESRQANARLGLEVFDFSYDTRTPWANQFWFDRHNFWLEAGEHKVGFDKIVMLGGRDVISWKPSVTVDVMAEPALGVTYAGTFNGVSFDTRPKYIETLLQATLALSSKTRLYSDTRWVKYDDPVLELDDGYLSTFLELSYNFSPGITFAASWGVDPYVIDAPVNEYAYIGRDLFLFDRQATGTRALGDFFSLADLIPAAEKALEDERRIQLEAIVRF